MDPLERFHVELAGCGVNAATTRLLCDRYDWALRVGDDPAWTDFYCELFACMRALRTQQGVTRVAMLDSVLRILEDDLGTQLFGERATLELRRELMDRAKAASILLMTEAAYTAG